MKTFKGIGLLIALFLLVLSFSRLIAQPYTLTLTKAGSGQGQVKVDNQIKDLPATVTFAASANIVLEAVPSTTSLSVFKEWSGTGIELASKNNPKIGLNIDGNKKVTVKFSKAYRLDVLIDGTGFLYLDSSQIFAPYNTIFEENRTVQLKALGTNAYVFTGWSGSVSQPLANPLNLIMDGNKKIKATFIQIITIKVLLAGGGADGKIKYKGINYSLPFYQQITEYPPPQMTLEAVPASGNVFKFWQTHDISVAGLPTINYTENPLTFDPYYKHRELLVIFRKLLNLNITNAGQGSGSVKYEDQEYTLPCTITIPSETIVKLYAVPGNVPGKTCVFAGWGGQLTGNTNPSSFKMVGNKDIIAKFELLPPVYITPPISKLSLTSSGLGSGQVKINSQLSSFPVEMDFVTGDKVTIEVVPGANTIFKGWSGDISGSNPVTIIMSKSKKAVVNFAPKPMMAPVKPLSPLKLPIKK